MGAFWSAVFLVFDREAPGARVARRMGVGGALVVVVAWVLSHVWMGENWMGTAGITLPVRSSAAVAATTSCEAIGHG